MFIFHEKRYEVFNSLEDNICAQLSMIMLMIYRDRFEVSYRAQIILQDIFINYWEIKPHYQH